MPHRACARKIAVAWPAASMLTLYQFLIGERLQLVDKQFRGCELLRQAEAMCGVLSRLLVDDRLDRGMIGCRDLKPVSRRLGHAISFEAGAYRAVRWEAE